MNHQFKGKTAIVTGGVGNIGKATVELFLHCGASVLIADYSEAGNEMCRELSEQGFDVLYQQGDIGDENQVASMVDTLMERWGRLDIMVANAGIAGLGRAEDVSEGDWHRVIDVNLTGVLNCTKYAVPAMRKNGGGAIVNTASVMGIVAPFNAVPYATTKGAVVHLTRATAVDYAAENIRINAVCPGHLETPVTVGGQQARAADKRDLLARYPMGRLGRPEEVAKAIAFLASEDASFITGTCLVVDGGYTAQ